MTKKYANLWDVHVRDTFTGTIDVVRVEAHKVSVDSGYVWFTAPGSLNTAVFPNQAVARIVRVEEAESADSGEKGVDRFSGEAEGTKLPRDLLSRDDVQVCGCR